MKEACFFLASLVSGVEAAFAATPTYYAVENYRGRVDNPFLGNPGLGIVYLDDFEPPNNYASPGSILVTPNATGWNGGISAAPFRGVKEDSSATDEDRGLGYRWTSTVIVGDTQKDPPGIHFDFTPDELGRLPEYAGAALLGKYDLQNAGGLFNNIFVVDSLGNEVTGGAWQIPKPLLSDPLPEDPSDFFMHFEGLHVPGGISRIHFRDFVEVDHLTYGYAIPEPSAVWLAMGSGFWLLHRRRGRGPADIPHTTAGCRWGMKMPQRNAAVRQC